MVGGDASTWLEGRIDVVGEWGHFDVVAEGESKSSERALRRGWRGRIEVVQGCASSG